MRDKLDFLGIFFFLPKNWEKEPKMSQKQYFFNLLENLVISYYWIWSIMEMYIIFCVPAQIPYLGKIFVPKIWAKMFSANQIAAFFNQPYFQKKSMK